MLPGSLCMELVYSAKNINLWLKKNAVLLCYLFQCQDDIKVWWLPMFIEIKPETAKTSAVVLTQLNHLGHQIWKNNNINRSLVCVLSMCVHVCVCVCEDTNINECRKTMIQYRKTQTFVEGLRTIKMMDQHLYEYIPIIAAFLFRFPCWTVFVLSISITCFVRSGWFSRICFLLSWSQLGGRTSLCLCHCASLGGVCIAMTAALQQL